MFWFGKRQVALVAIVNRDGSSPNDVSLAALPILFR